jgi:predicted alpha/beta-hydrolase family hydrolase
LTVVSAEILFDGPASAALTLALAHGAGGPMDSPFMTTMARGIVERGFRVARFEFPYMQARRTGGRRGAPDSPPVLRAAWLRTIAELGGGEKLVIGGKSMGGRIASMVADEAGVRGLVCLGYPFHPPGKPERLRTAHLADLKTPALIVQGERDPFGPREEVLGLRLSPSIRLVWIEAGDHSFKPPAKSGRTEAGNLAEAIAAVRDFLTALV